MKSGVVTVFLGFANSAIAKGEGGVNPRRSRNFGNPLDAVGPLKCTVRGYFSGNKSYTGAQHQGPDTAARYPKSESTAANTD